MWPPNPSRFHTAICRLFPEARCPSLPACRRPNGGRRRGILVISPIAVAPAALAVGGPAWPPPRLHRAWQLGLWSYREASTKGGLLLVFLWAGPGAAGLGASRGAQARARGQEAGSSRPCTWHLRWGGHSHGTPAACALAQPQRGPLLCPCVLQRPAGPSILHLLLEWASTIEQRSNNKCGLEPVNSTFSQVHRPVLDD